MTRLTSAEEAKGIAWLRRLDDGKTIRMKAVSLPGFFHIILSSTIKTLDLKVKIEYGKVTIRSTTIDRKAESK